MYIRFIYNKTNYDFVTDLKNGNKMVTKSTFDLPTKMPYFGIFFFKVFLQTSKIVLFKTKSTTVGKINNI